MNRKFFFLEIVHQNTSRTSTLLKRFHRLIMQQAATGYTAWSHSDTLRLLRRVRWLQYDTERNHMNQVTQQHHHTASQMQLSLSTAAQLCFLFLVISFVIVLAFFLWKCHSSESRSRPTCCYTTVQQFFGRCTHTAEQFTRSATKTDVNDAVENEVGSKVDEKQTVGDDGGCLVDVVGGRRARRGISDTDNVETEEQRWRRHAHNEDDD